MHYIYGDGEKILTKAVNLEKDFLRGYDKGFFFLIVFSSPCPRLFSLKIGQCKKVEIFYRYGDFGLVVEKI